MSNSRERQTLLTGAEQQAHDPPDSQPVRFVIDLCVLPAPIKVPQPRSEELKRFRFFTRRSVVNGCDSLVLTMGFFASREESERWLRALLNTHPDACIGVMPAAPRAVVPEPPVIDGVEVLRVLQVRPPIHADASDETDRDGYTVVSHERARTPAGPAPAAPSPSPLALSPPRVSVPSATVASPTRATSKRARGLEETLDDLASSAISLESDDTGATTGVRHLSIEFARKPKRADKSSKTRKR
jgi:hypothetical protein